jgi:hypothetical protein
MKSDSKKNPAPIAPTSAEPSNAAGAKPQVAKPLKGTLVKKTGNAKGGTDPYTQAKPSRTKITATGGARYGIRVKFQHSTAPEAGATQGNGRILSSAVKRSAPNFKDGMAE